MARRSSRSVTAPSRGGNPSAVIVVFLVFSLLGNIALGVFFYLAQDKIVQAEKKAKDAEDGLKKVKADSNLDQTYYIARLRALLDPKSLDQKGFEELTRLESERKQNKTEGKEVDRRHEAWFDGLVENTEKQIGKYESTTTQESAPSFQKLIQGKDDDIDRLTKERNVAQADAKNHKSLLEQHENTWNQAALLAVWAKQVEDLRKEWENKVKTADALAQTHKASFDKIKQEYDDYVQAAQAALNKEVAKHEKEREQLAKEIKELKLSVGTGGVATTDPKSKVPEATDLGDPRGRIVRAEADGQTVIIDLGSDHRVVPQLTFTVHGIGVGEKPLRDPKAKLEVISVLSKNQSLARVTRMFKPENARENNNPETESNWVKDPRDYWRVRNPIMKGDLIYNPAWAPDRRVHIALNGVFDLEGDGKDDLPVLKKMLEDRGTIVDAWLELEGDAYVMRGKVTERTELIVVGSRPPFVAAAPPKPGEPKVDTKDDFERMERDALSRAIEPISLKRFLARMGYTDISLPSGKGGGLIPLYELPPDKMPGKP